MKVNDVAKKANPLSDANADLLHYKAKAQRLESTLKKLLAERGKLKAFTADIAASVNAFQPYARPRLFSIKPPSSSTPIAAVLKLSDWQIGEVIEKAETEGFGEFNHAIAERRVEQLCDSFIAWIDMHRRAGYNLKRLDIFSEADLVSGNIHYELEVTNEFPVPVAATKAGFLLAHCIGRLAAYFEDIRVWEESCDNHGRLTRKSQAKQGAKNNYSYVSHIICNQALAKHDHVKTIMGDGTKLLADVLGINFLISHGHHIMGSMGIPYYGMERDRAREAVKRMNTDKTFKYISIGHWHVPAIVSGNILINGSLPGTTEFDHQQGRHAAPSQVSFMVHPKYGIFNWVPWKLD